MFETKKTLIVVYKDELLMNQLKKMVETHDDNEQGVIGTRNNSINIVSWTEKVWQSRARRRRIRKARSRTGSDAGNTRDSPKTSKPDSSRGLTSVSVLSFPTRFSESPRCSTTFATRRRILPVSPKIHWKTNPAIWN